MVRRPVFFCFFMVFLFFMGYFGCILRFQQGNLGNSPYNCNERTGVSRHENIEQGPCFYLGLCVASMLNGVYFQSVINTSVLT